MSELLDTLARLRLAIQTRPARESRFRRRVARAWDRAVLRGDDRMADMLFRRLWPGVLLDDDETTPPEVGGANPKD